MDAKGDVTRVEIFGQTYTVRADGDGEYVKQLAAYVDRTMNDIARHAPTVDPAKIAILAALNVCDDLFQEKDRSRKGERRLEELEQKTSAWIRRLEENLDV